jgi:hypothetical protein
MMRLKEALASLSALVLFALALPHAALGQDAREEAQLQRLAAEIQRLVAMGGEAVPAWIDLEVHAYQEDWPGPPDMGHWTVSFQHSGHWTFVRRPGAPDGVYQVAYGDVGTGGRALPSLSGIDGSGYEICWDGHGQPWQTQFGGPPEVVPGMLSARGEGDRITLWYGAPLIEMYHPGHFHIPEQSDCATMREAGLVEFRLATSNLEDVGAEFNEYGEFLLATFSWGDLVAAAEGRSGPLPIELVLETEEVALSVRGSVGGPRR